MPHRLSPFAAVVATCTLAASTAAAQTKYSLVLIDPGQPLNGVTADGFPVTGIPFSSVELPQPVAVKLPAGWQGMVMLGFCQGAEVGYVTGKLGVGGASGGAQFSIPTHAGLWSAPFYDFNDLQNSMNESVAAGCDGNVQVGSDANGSGVSHAVMWFGGAKTQVDLHSGPYQSTSLNSVNGNTQVGAGTLNRIIINGVEVSRQVTHALLWHGTVKSLTDLHPAGFLDSYATQFGPAKEVGYADNIDANGSLIWNAFVWSGSAASAVNLQQFVPANFTSSQAYFIDVPTGIISGTVSNGPNTPGMIALWVPVQ